MIAARELVRMACDRGGHDNVTVAVIVAGERAAEFDGEYGPPPELARADEELQTPPPADPPEEADEELEGLGSPNELMPLSAEIEVELTREAGHRGADRSTGPRRTVIFGLAAGFVVLLAGGALLLFLLAGIALFVSSGA